MFPRNERMGFTLQESAESRALTFALPYASDVTMESSATICREILQHIVTLKERFHFKLGHP